MARVSALDVRVFVLREGKSKSALACLLGKRGKSRRCSIASSAGAAVRELAGGKRAARAEVDRFMDRVEDAAGKKQVLERRGGKIDGGNPDDAVVAGAIPLRDRPDLSLATRSPPHTHP